MLVRAARAGNVGAAQLILCSVHAPTIDALARAGFVRPARLSADMLPQLARAAQRTRLREVPVYQERQETAESRFVVGVARALGHHYLALTGRRPTVVTAIKGQTYGQAYGPFLDFVSAVFNVMGIRHSAERAARTASGAFRVSRSRN
jgi:hypothetical protein